MSYITVELYLDAVPYAPFVYVMERPYLVVPSTLHAETGLRSSSRRVAGGTKSSGPLLLKKGRKLHSSFLSLRILLHGVDTDLYQFFDVSFYYTAAALGTTCGDSPSDHVFHTSRLVVGDRQKWKS